MTRTLKWIGGGIAAAMLLGLAGLFSGDVVEAQPSGPPHRFAGSVSLDGEPAAAGLSVTAIIGGVECGSAATVITSTAGSTYSVDVPDSCADAGDTVSFQVGGYDAVETGTWSGGGRTDLDLTASSMMPEDPEDSMDECPDDMGEGMNDDAPTEPSEPAEPAAPSEPMDDMSDDMADDCPTDDMDDMADPEEPSTPGEPSEDPSEPEASDDMTPKVADTGTGLTATNASSLATILGVTALAILLGSYTFARRRR